MVRYDDLGDDNMVDLLEDNVGDLLDDLSEDNMGDLSDWYYGLWQKTKNSNNYKFSEYNLYGVVVHGCGGNVSLMGLAFVVDISGIYLNYNLK